ncbi:hypothetical protein LCGC14_1808320 [marine sediment metagenome]|uniref:Uncharacterized protein n=1 Tax=marine sediment metagenome TaxID=412755 RepID=A0A0F9GMC6_9ZZZZ
MKWINSTPASATNYTRFYYTNNDGSIVGSIVVSRNPGTHRIDWSTRQSNGTAETSGLAKSAVEKSAKMEAK